ncbi:MAG: peptide deformylase [Clostridia bacterium]|jgi:peptide deformylase|nr:peptide deformylase [Clostridia bacterium]
MAIRNIRKDDEDEILRKKSRVVEEINDNIITLLDDMKETMYETKGVGLAAVQVGVLKRIFIVDVTEDKTGYIEFINPEIIEKDGSQVGPEGCLSVPGVYGDVERANHIVVRAFDREGNEFELEAEEFLARAVQHEYDHLDGKIFRDIATKFYDPEEFKKEVEDGR